VPQTARDGFSFGSRVRAGAAVSRSGFGYPRICNQGPTLFQVTAKLEPSADNARRSDLGWFQSLPAATETQFNIVYEARP
jgi:hypothetical protein